MIRSVLINFRFPSHAGNSHILQILYRSLNAIRDFHQNSITKNYYQYFKISHYVHTIGKHCLKRLLQIYALQHYII